ncbi:hypothetical protein BB560_002616 [Smittium megazygosporum]|uniref:Hexosyltransferase n=1 Tax=Smittium megazygosporum TaxID=133381 RepID=A0A2T9ZE93_9FUNG|nr:hypothetical protein BB560_002616 [Smittium megazygosporum]
MASPALSKERLPPEGAMRWGEIIKFDDQLEQPKDIRLHKILSDSPYKKTIKYMFRGPFSSKYVDLFASQLNSDIVCDADYKDEACTINLQSNYKWGTLSSKLRDLLAYYCQRDISNTVFIKIDDDLIISNRELNRLIDRFSKSDCLLAGHIATDFPFYWATGQIYLFKSSELMRICNKPILKEEPFHGSEDIYLGYLFNIVDKNKVCDIDKYTEYFHKEYSDERLNITYIQQHNY